VRHRPRHARSDASLARRPLPHALLGTLCACAVIAAACVALAAPAHASGRPTVASLSRYRGPYWGATLVTVRGSNFTDVQKVLFGNKTAYAVDVVSPTKLTVLDPQHKYATVHVRVVTGAGSSSRTALDRFTFTRPTMNTPIMGGLTALQEQKISVRVRAAHRGAYTAPWSSHWTSAMGLTAVRRARSWLGLPYSWAGGDGSGPTTGVCAHNGGGDFDCHVVGFDCSGLALYAWSPYEQLVHYAATQHGQAGRFHPTIGQLMPGDLVFFSGYIANGIGHVAVYQGHGMVIEAAQSGTEVMRSRLTDVIAASGRYRGATRPMSTGQQGPGPRITSVTKQISSAGGYVHISGRRLGATTAVYVGGTFVYSFVRRTATHLVVKVPAHAAGRVVISVSNAWGSAQRSLTYVGAPQITSLSPSSGPPSGGTTVTVHGDALGDARRVKIDGKAVSFHVLGPHRLTLTTPAHPVGSVPVVVSSPFGVSNAASFTFTSSSPSPTPTTSSPTSTSAPPGSPARYVRSGRVFADRIGDDWFLVGRLFARNSRDYLRQCSGSDALRRALLAGRLDCEPR
jgi:cell wall-associated NlpC family hydrolase